MHNVNQKGEAIVRKRKHTMDERIMLRLTGNTKDQLYRLAERLEMSASDVIRQAVRRTIEESAVAVKR